jgi:hypothetical protein
MHNQPPPLPDKWKRYVYDDGGRAALAHVFPRHGGCVARAIAIATGKKYYEVHNDLGALCALYWNDPALRFSHLGGCHHQQPPSPDGGIPDHITRLYLGTLHWQWTSTNKARLHRCDMPMGRIIVSVSKHLVALIDHVVHDTYDHWKGKRPVHGYYCIKGKQS